MRLLLALFPIVMMLQEGLGYRIDFGTRLSGKNIIIALSLLIIGTRMAQEGRLRIELPLIHLFFVILIVYAIASWFVAAFVIGYEHYPVRANGIFLKLLLIDRYLVFLAFFYLPRTQAEVMSVLKILLGVVLFAQFVTVGEALGVLPTNLTVVRDSGRVVGLIGESNQFALFTALFLPALLAFAATSHGLIRLVWLCGALLSVATLAITLSRGAMVGVVTSLVLGLFLFRRRLSPQKVLHWAAGIAVVLVIGLGLIWGQYGDVVYERVIADTLRQQEVSGISMGRTDIWLALLDKMIEVPITLLSGFGWRVYWSLPHVLSPHNTYLDYWFNLGIPGVASFMAILLMGLVWAYRGSTWAEGDSRVHFSAFAFGLLAVMAGLLFTEWYEPWSYFWPYFGLVMRLVVITRSTATDRAIDLGPNAGAAVPISISPTSLKYGWKRST